MGEDNKEDSPSTSRINDQNDDDKRNKIPRNDPRDEYMSSEESHTTTDTRKSKDAVDGRAMVPKAPDMKREVQQSKRRVKERRVKKRAMKRRRSQVRRHIRKAPRKNMRYARDRNVSPTTLVLSSDSGRSKSPFCKYCGHRCCLRRYEKQTRNECKVKKKLIKRSHKKRPIRIVKCSGQGIQAGSRSAMLSPLFINSSALPDTEVPNTSINYQEITPEMIHETVSRLMKWRQYVATSAVMKHMMSNYPVNRDEVQLLGELTEKLLIAVRVGFLRQAADELWTLSEPLQKRKLTKNHVTLFWKIYTDTMRPVTRKTKSNVKSENGDQNAERSNMFI